MTKQSVAQVGLCSTPASGHVAKPMPKGQPIKAAKRRDAPADDVQRSYHMVPDDSHKSRTEPGAAGASLVASMFDGDTPDKADEPSAWCNVMRSARQQRQGTGGMATSDCEQSGGCGRQAAADSHAVDSAPDWLATQAATQIAAVPSMAESQPFPFDFAALVPDRPKRASTPPGLLIQRV